VELEVECRNKPGAIVHKWACRDGSLNDGVEYKIVAPVAKISKAAMDIAQRARLLGCVAEKSCGFHVHMPPPGPIGGAWRREIPADFNLDIPREERCLQLNAAGQPEITKMIRSGSLPVSPWKTVAYWLARNEDYFFQMMPPARRNNGFCRKLGTNVQGIMDHYGWMSMSRHGTLECRIHPGTTNPFKVAGWLAVCQDLRSFLVDMVTTVCRQKTKDGTEYGAEVSVLAKPEDIPWSPVARAYIKARHDAGGCLESYGFSA
jgi:hypothetical protein